MTDIIIPTYKPYAPCLVKCIESIYRHTNRFNLILACSPYGQVKNINWGLDRAKSKFVVILDWDIQVSEGWIDKLIASFEDNIGIMGSKMSGEYERWKGLSSQCKDGVQDWPTLPGGLMMFRNIGLRWDDNFQSGYWADTDFCRQFREKGYRVCINGDVTVDHSLHNSTTNPDLKNLMREGEIIYHKKWGNNEF